METLFDERGFRNRVLLCPLGFDSTPLSVSWEYNGGRGNRDDLSEHRSSLLSLERSIPVEDRGLEYLF